MTLLIATALPVAGTIEDGEFKINKNGDGGIKEIPGIEMEVIDIENSFFNSEKTGDVGYSSDSDVFGYPNDEEPITSFGYEMYNLIWHTERNCWLYSFRFDWYHTKYTNGVKDEWPNVCFQAFLDIDAQGTIPGSGKPFDVGGWNVEIAGQYDYSMATALCGLMISFIPYVGIAFETGAALAQALDNAEPDDQYEWISGPSEWESDGFFQYDCYIRPDTIYDLKFKTNFWGSCNEPGDTNHWMLWRFTGTSPATESPLSLTPSSWDFGRWLVDDCSPTKSFTLKNNGNNEEFIDHMTSNLPSLHDCFEITQSLENYWLQPGESKTIKVRFCPTVEGDFNAELSAYMPFSSFSPTSILTGTGYDSCCFPAGTRITMADGSYKNIEDIRFGDRVLSYDIKNCRFTSWRVKLLGNPIHPVYEINNGLLSFTKDHPIRVKKPDETTGWGAVDIDAAKSFTRLKNDVLTIEVEDQVFIADEEWIEIAKIEFKPEPVQTYNIMSFSGTKTYFANDVLVFEENPPLSVWRANNFYIRGYIDAWINSLLDVCFQY